MYIPRAFNQPDKAKAVEFIKKFHFGTLISKNADGTSLATHLPFAVNYNNESDGLVLYSHLAKANSQWQELSGQRVLAIFQAPHAYISPELYTRPQSVPTWNYEAVHVYGQIHFLESEQEIDALMHRMIEFLEPAYFKKWDLLDADYKRKLYHALVAFELKTDELQAVQKLSQDRNAEEKSNIISHLSNSDTEHERLIADSMKTLFEPNKE